MKALKLVVLSLLVAFSIGTASAQMVRNHANTFKGGHHRHHHHHRR